MNTPPVSDQPVLCDLAVIGGGIHGVHLLVRLRAAGLLAGIRCVVLEPNGLLSRWREMTAAVGMSHLRSPSVHNLGAHPHSLRAFIRESGLESADAFLPPYQQPLMALFDSHSAAEIEQASLQQLQRRCRALSLSAGESAVRIETTTGPVLASRVVLAIGFGERPCWPDWATRDKASGARIEHVFEAGFRRERLEPCATVTIVGGGLSAAQLAISLARVSAGPQVRLVVRHPFRVHRFDADPGWLGPKYLASFAMEKDLSKRRAIIRSARNRGSVPIEVFKELRRLEESGRIEVTFSDIIAFDAGAVQLRTGERFASDAVVLATGFDHSSPGREMFERMGDLPRAPCGYPIVDASLRWHPRIFVMGPLAELELGPTARNIVGAQRGADRIVRALELELRGPAGAST